MSPKYAVSEALAPTKNISGNWPVGCCCHRPHETTSKDVNQQPVRTGNDGSLLEVNEGRNKV